MDATGANTAAKAAISTLNDSIAIGKEGGKLVASVQADSRSAVLQQHRIRDRERHRQEHIGSQQEQKAYQKFSANKEEAKATEDLKQHILKVHGVAGWNDFLKAKAEVEAQDREESAHISEDEHKMADVTWWCFAAGALLAYLITNG
jgi:hypothetical protein